MRPEDVRLCSPRFPTKNAADLKRHEDAGKLDRCDSFGAMPSGFGLAHCGCAVALVLAVTGLCADRRSAPRRAAPTSVADIAEGLQEPVVNISTTQT